MANAVATWYKLTRDTAVDQGAVYPLKAAGAPAKQSAVRVVSLAEVPSEPSRPNKRLCYGITAALAGLLSVMVASSVEICFLIARAEERANELQPLV